MKVGETLLISSRKSPAERMHLSTSSGGLRNILGFGLIILCCLHTPPPSLQPSNQSRDIPIDTFVISLSQVRKGEHNMASRKKVLLKVRPPVSFVDFKGELVLIVLGDHPW